MSESNPLLVSPTTGEVLALNHGDWTGVYNQPTEENPEPDAVPQVVVAPFFVTSPTETGNIVRVNDGDWTPTATIVTAQIGIGATQAAFVKFADGLSATVPTGTVGRLSALFSAANGDKTAPAVWIDSGVDVADPVSSAFPADLDPEDWTSEEVLTGTVSGKRTTTLDSGVTVPAGFELRWYSGPQSGGLAQLSATTAITPGQTYVTNGAMTVGVTCFNNYFWRNLTTDAMQRAHPLGEQIEFVIEGIPSTPNVPGVDPEFTPDATVSTVAAVRAQFAAWNTGSQTSDFVCGINASTSGTFDLTGLVNNSNYIFWVRAVGTFSNFDCSVKHTGPMRLDGSKGVMVTRMRIISGATSSITAASADRCGYDRCMMDGAEITTAVNPQGSTEPTANPLVLINNATNFRFSHNLVRFVQRGVVFSFCDGVLDYGNMTDYVREDDWKIFNGIRNWNHDRNWPARRHRHGAPGTDPHEDAMQHQGIYMVGGSFYGNIGMSAYPSWWYGTTQPFGDQFLFFRPDAVNYAPPQLMDLRDVTVEQNIALNGSPLLAMRWSNINNVVFQDNTHIMFGGANINQALITGSEDVFSGAGLIVRRNFCADGQSATFPTSVGEGTGGIRVPVGVYTSRNYSALVNWFTYGIPGQSASGSITTPPATLKAMHPKEGREIHWGTPTNPCGARVRMRELYDTTFRATQNAAVGYKVYPGDVGWPVARSHKDAWNYDNFVSSTYTGAYDSNGDNA